MNQSKLVNVAVVGATGAVGQAILQVLEKRNFPINNLYLLASSRSAGKKIIFKNQSYSVIDIDAFDFSKVQVGLFSAGGSVSEKYAPIAAKAGCVVVDNTSHFRQDKDIPLVVSEVNPEKIAEYKNRNIISNPNCSTIQMLVALKPIYDAVGIERINVATYQSVSGAGYKGVEELISQTKEVLDGKKPTIKNFSTQIAFNAIPHIDVFQENGYAREEMKMVWETQKIFGDESIKVNPTCVRIPSYCGHSEAVHIETKEKISAAQVKQLLSKAPGVMVVDERENGGYPTNATHAAGADEVFVGRIREDISHLKGINLWVVSDNLLKGAALNTVQIAEILVKKYL